MLSACLKKAGFETCMIFLPDIHEMMVGTDYGTRHVTPAALQQIVDLSADAGLVGISAMTTSFLLARQLTQALHASLTVPVIWGGVHPTVCPEACLQYADLVCIGEGEQAIVTLARRIAGGHDYSNVNNLAWLDSEGRLVINPPYPLERNLDALPFPDYEFERHYVLHEGQVIPFSQDLMYYYLTDLGSWASGPVYGLLTTRGCPYRCAYCINSTLITIYPGWCKLRRRSLGNVIAEIHTARARLPGIEAIAIRDDTFLANPESYIAEFSQLYRTEVGLPFRVHTTAQTASPAKLQYLAEAGMRLVIMGIQSGSPRIQKLYNRHISNDQIIRAAEVIHSFQHWVPCPMYDIITDNPYETDDDRFDTLRLVHNLPRPFRLSLFSLTFYPGTSIYHRAKADGLIKGDEHDIYTRNFQMFDSNYYNLALFCHGLNLPRPFLYLLTRRFVFNLLNREPINRLCGWFLDQLLALRLSKNRRLYSHHRLRWLAGRKAGEHA
jgi:radical SAM superfamily enzyme YgiQ (UPF0313 family)